MDFGGEFEKSGNVVVAVVVVAARARPLGLLAPSFVYNLKVLPAAAPRRPPPAPA